MYHEGVTALPLRLTFLFRHRLLLAVVAAVLLVDQGTKYLVTSRLSPLASFPREGVVRITHTYNTGAAFGLFPNQLLFLIGASFVGIALLLLFYRSRPLPGPLLKVSLGLQLGGAVGNLVDRIRLGYVVDFIDLGWWPVFNLADSSLVLGLLMLVGLILLEREPWLQKSGGRGDEGDAG